MTPKDLAIIFIYSLVIFAIAKVLIAWLHGGINTDVAWEWFLRGFFMTWGFMACFFAVFLLIKIVMKLTP